MAAGSCNKNRVRAEVSLPFHAGGADWRRDPRGGGAEAPGITTILTRLGENLTTASQFEEVTLHYLDVLDRVAAAGLDAQISIKPTQLGLDLDPALCERNLLRLLDRAAERRNFVWIDMEGSPYVEPTLALFRRARARTPLVGIALQAYLYRTAKDVEALIPLGAAIRIVKGAYLEPPEVAFPKKSDVDENFFKLCTRLLADDARRAGALLHIATHDVALADRLTAYIEKNGVPSSAFEFAMLYGIQRGQQARLAAAGSACASSSVMANTGSRGTCAGSPSGRPTCGSS